MKKLILLLLFLTMSTLSNAQVITTPSTPVPTYTLVLICPIPSGETFDSIATSSDGKIYFITNKNVYQLIKS